MGAGTNHVILAELQCYYLYLEIVTRVCMSANLITSMIVVACPVC